LILSGPGFEPVTSRVAGRRCPCILSHLIQVIVIIFQLALMRYLGWVSHHEPRNDVSLFGSYGGALKKFQIVNK
jgi:hypothetical protein